MIIIYTVVLMQLYMATCFYNKEYWYLYYFLCKILNRKVTVGFPLSLPHQQLATKSLFIVHCLQIPFCYLGRKYRHLQKQKLLISVQHKRTLIRRWEQSFQRQHTRLPRQKEHSCSQRINVAQSEREVADTGVYGHSVPSSLNFISMVGQAIH